ncbi:hypothetical protein [Citricoccus sp. NR2]|uniref:hypothetical protein n=1 Tax=Citricoccus sp. NR2 TaxID=3004095 RepID=UPI0022DE0FF7|nr:hypothetical protein [Citricoccus sp. NR2]WBL18187.1 hypothetical protein O1A05_10355 [Citricoccus sp. NR2]
MIKRVLLIGVGAAAGWFGHSLINKGRDAAVVQAEESLRTTFAPENLGRTAGQAAATALTEGARSFIGQLRAEIPGWSTQADDIITGTASDVTRTSSTVTPTDPSHPRKQA